MVFPYKVLAGEKLPLSGTGCSHSHLYLCNWILCTWKDGVYIKMGLSRPYWPLQICIYNILDISHTELSWRIIPIHFLSFLDTKMTSVVQICSGRRQGLVCLVHPGMRDKRRVSEIDLSQPRHETAFWWRHNGPVMSQLTDPIKWPNYPLELIRIYVHINTHNKESGTPKMLSINKCTTVFDIFVHIHIIWVLMDAMRYFALRINVATSP